MKNKILIISVFLACVFFSACGAEEPNNEIKLRYYKDGYKEKCNDILERSTNSTLKDIKVASVAGNSDQSFFVDVDNDGQDEELKYFETRTYPTLEEMVDGKRHGFPGPNVRTASYSGNYIIKVDQKHYVLHVTHEGPIELQQLKEITLEEMRERKMDSRVKPPLYDTEVLCKYYEDGH